MTGKYTDVSYVIESLYRDYGGAFDTEIEVSDVIEWVWEVLNFIGHPSILVDKVTDGTGTNPPLIDIDDYRGTLPNYDTQMPFVCSYSPYKGDSEYNVDVYESTYTYHTNDNYIFTSVEECQLEMSYRAFPTSPLGLPLIPDDAKIIKAVKAYIAHIISRQMRMAKSDSIPRDIYDEIKQEYAWYIGSASTKARMPSKDKLESIKNRFVRLKQNPNLHSASFRYMPDKERLILHNNVGA